jgi:hypothetical protein
LSIEFVSVFIQQIFIECQVCSKQLCLGEKYKEICRDLWVGGFCLPEEEHRETRKFKSPYKQDILWNMPNDTNANRF